MLADTAVDPTTVDLFDPQWHRDGPPHALLARLRANRPPDLTRSSASAATSTRN